MPLAGVLQGAVVTPTYPRVSITRLFTGERIQRRRYTARTTKITKRSIFEFADRCSNKSATWLGLLWPFLILNVRPLEFVLTRLYL